METIHPSSLAGRDDLAPELARRTGRYTQWMDRVLPGRLTGLYLVGSPGLGDFSDKQSNIDLVAVTDRRLSPEELVLAARGHRNLRRRRRQPAVCYATWEDLAAPPSAGGAVSFVGSRLVEPDRLANPFTWAVLAAGPVVLRGPARPEVRSDGHALAAWSAARLPHVLDGYRSLVLRRWVARAVLEAARTAHGAAHGEVIPLCRAADEPALSREQRILRDAGGYREGRGTSMYWGPFEREYDARRLVAQLVAGSAASLSRP